MYTAKFKKMRRKTIKGKHCIFVFVIFILAYVCVRLYVTNTCVDNAQKEEATNKSERHSYGVIGILSADKNIELRNFQRMMFSNHKSSNVLIRFLLNKPTPETLEESRNFTDIIYINSSYSGRAVRFGEKLSKWFKLSTELFPDANFVGKMDDDVFICDPSFKVVWENWSPLMYLGWAYTGHVIVVNRIDDMFIILGKELIRRISKRKYCFDLDNCDSSRELYDKHYGDRTISLWLSIYDDVIAVPINSIVIHKYNLTFESGLCDKYFLLHRIKEPKMMHQVYQDTKAKMNVPTTKFIGVSGNIFNGKRTRIYHGTFLNTSINAFKLRDYITCSLWGVVTTIHSLNSAIEKASYKMCLVIVADEKTPENSFVKASSPKIKFLSVNEQKMITTEGLELMQHIPWNHFGRKNVGYVYAIMHGAESVFDFDDDNVLIESLPTLNEWYVSPQVRVFNPYPTFTSLEIIPWPRGFPLSDIKNSSTWERLTNMKKERVHPSTIGVIQSLANYEPDVDAIWRLTNKLPLNFNDDLQLILRPGTMAPYNSQATLHYALWGLLLPVSVHSRVSDIWRSYITQRLLWDIGQTVGFVSPFVEQVRNAHSLKADFNSEIPLYERTEAMIDVLQTWKGTSQNLEGRMVELYIELYEREFVDYSDVILAHMWIRTLKQINYKFPSLNY